jgi:hypothetical protein
VIRNGTSMKAHKELLLALEYARTRLAIAMAVETKSTPTAQWQYYLDTTDRMCRYMKKLRKSDFTASPGLQNLDRAVETLKRLPVHDKAMRLCRIIRDIVAELE